MYFKQVPLLVFAAVFATAAITSAAVRFESSDGRVGSHDIQIKIKPGKTYMIPLPATKYPGAPFGITIADPGFDPGDNGRGSWMMHVLVSDANGAISWIEQPSNSGINVGSTAYPGQTLAVGGICAETGGCIALVNAVPNGSVEGLQLVVASSAPSAQTFVISVPD